MNPTRHGDRPLEREIHTGQHEKRARTSPVGLCVCTFLMVFLYVKSGSVDCSSCCHYGLPMALVSMPRAGLVRRSHFLALLHSLWKGSMKGCRERETYGTMGGDCHTCHWLRYTRIWLDSYADNQQRSKILTCRLTGVVWLRPHTYLNT